MAEKCEDIVRPVCLISVTNDYVKRQVLSRGLNFVPNLNFDVFSTLLDINKFIRNLTVKRHFLTTEANMDEQTVEPVAYSNPYRLLMFQEQLALTCLEDLADGTTQKLNNSQIPEFITKNPRFYPIQSRTDSMDTFQLIMERELHKIKNQTGFDETLHNLSIAEKQAIKSLKENENIVIRMADKGGSITIMDRAMYMEQILLLLDDVDTYAKLSYNPTNDFSTLLRDLLDEGIYHGLINKKQYDYLNLPPLGVSLLPICSSPPPVFMQNPSLVQNRGDGLQEVGVSLLMCALMDCRKWGCLFLCVLCALTAFLPDSASTIHCCWDAGFFKKYIKILEDKEYTNIKNIFFYLKMPSCVVKGCTRASRRTESGIILHVFPKDKDRIRKWLLATGQEFENLEEFVNKIFDAKKNDTYRLCSKHFGPYDYRYKPKTGKKKLSENAVPSLFTITTTSSQAKKGRKHTETMATVCPPLQPGDRCPTCCQLIPPTAPEESSTSFSEKSVSTQHTQPITSVPDSGEKIKIEPNDLKITSQSTEQSHDIVDPFLVPVTPPSLSDSSPLKEQDSNFKISHITSWMVHNCCVVPTVYTSEQLNVGGTADVI
ncbi:uncharacterized protein LOC142760597 [Rhinoderma darwinii]|uniref:uncharacterized protein LOC142760597 n=1 Tax=Rhinoderma darwinii TaxID=43563 RepID=UPI003F67A624